MKVYRRIVRAIIRRICKRNNFVLPREFIHPFNFWNINMMHGLARGYAKNCGLSMEEGVAYLDPVIAERLDDIIIFWRFVAFAVSCDSEKHLCIVRKKYIEILRKNLLDNGRCYR